MPDAAAPVVLGNLATTIAHQKIVTCIDVISSTILVYDVVLNLKSEIRLVWSRKWTKITVLYLVQRYLPFFDTTGVVLHRQLAEGQNARDCSLEIYIGGWCYMTGIVLSEVIMPPVPHFQGCLVSGASSDMLYMCWVLLMVYDTGALIMILIPGISAFQAGGKSALANAVYRDGKSSFAEAVRIFCITLTSLGMIGIIYYALIFVISLANVVVILTLGHDLARLVCSFERVIHSVFASRAVLQIRRVAALEPTMSTVHTLEFVVRAHDYEDDTSDFWEE